MSDAVKVERVGAIAILRLDDPSTLNALSPAIKEGLAAKVPMLLADAAVSTVVLTGTGKAFCAGGDIRAMTDPEGRKAPAVRTRMRAAHSWARALLDCDKPVIAAVNGVAVGGGLALALLADIIIASREAYFLSGYSRLGALPDLGLLQTLPWAIGSLRAKEMILLNRRAWRSSSSKRPLHRPSPSAVTSSAKVSMPSWPSAGRDFRRRGRATALGAQPWRRVLCVSPLTLDPSPFRVLRARRPPTIAMAAAGASSGATLAAPCPDVLKATRRGSWASKSLRWARRLGTG